MFLLELLAIAFPFVVLILKTSLRNLAAEIGWEKSHTLAVHQRNKKVLLSLCRYHAYLRESAYVHI